MQTQAQHEPPELPARESAQYRELFASTPVDHTVKPAHRVSFPNSYFIHDVRFSPDGRVAYALIDGQSIDLWAAGLSRWPQALGGALGLLLLLYVVVVLRVRRRAQVRGAPHCRRCNYNLVAHVPAAVAPGAEQVLPPMGTRCPECGVDVGLKTPRRGRSTRRRLLIPTVAMLACITAYGLLFLSGIAPTKGGAAATLGLWSPWVDAFADTHQIQWLLSHRVTVANIDTVDTRSGQITGRLRTFGGGVRGTMGISPDGRHLAVCDARSQVLWISTASGHLSASTTGGDFQPSLLHCGCFIGFAGPYDDPWLYYSATDTARKVSRLLKWRPSNGEQRVVIEEPAYAMTYPNGRTIVCTRRYALLHGQEGVGTLSAPEFLQAYEEETYPITVRGPEDPVGADGRTFVAGPKFLCSSPLIAAPSGSEVFLSGSSRGVFSFDAVTGAPLEIIRPMGREVPHDELTVSDDGTQLFTSCYPDAILIRDVRAKRWVARLEIPAGFIGPGLTVSHDGRWLAATPFKSMGSNYKHELDLYDLSALDTKAAQTP